MQQEKVIHRSIFAFLIFLFIPTHFTTRMQAFYFKKFIVRLKLKKNKNYFFNFALWKFMSVQLSVVYVFWWAQILLTTFSFDLCYYASAATNDTPAERM